MQRANKTLKPAGRDRSLRTKISFLGCVGSTWPIHHPSSDHALHSFIQRTQSTVRIPYVAWSYMNWYWIGSRKKLNLDSFSALENSVTSPSELLLTLHGHVAIMHSFISLVSLRMSSIAPEIHPLSLVSSFHLLKHYSLCPSQNWERRGNIFWWIYNKCYKIHVYCFATCVSMLSLYVTHCDQIFKLLGWVHHDRRRPSFFLEFMNIFT